MRRGTAVISVVAVLFTLLGCARIGTSGPVVSGGPAGKPAGLQALVPGPGPGDSPEQIVQGFMRAGLSARSEYEAARLFLTTERATDWRPSQQTLVYSDEVKLSGFADNPQAPAGDEPTTSSGIVSVQVVATIDATGHLLHDSTDRRQNVGFSLVRQKGEWRLDAVPDMTLISADDLEFVFSRFAVYFLDPTGSYLVPDARWLPDTDSTPTLLAALLLDGPTAFLAGAVVSAFPEGVELAPPSGVGIEDGLASVDLTSQARSAPPPQRALMRSQMLATLQQVAEVADVTLTVENGPLEVPESTVRRQPDGRGGLVVLREGVLLRLDNGAFAEVAGVPPLADLDPEAIAADYSTARFAVLTGGGGELRLLRVDKPVADPVLVADRLTRPSFDWRGWVWSTAADCEGTVSAVSPEGRVVEVNASWLDGRQLTAMRVSREGARVIVASSGPDGPRLDLASVIRDGAGAPVTLQQADPALVGDNLAAVDDVAWIDELQVAALGRRPADQGERVLRLELGELTAQALSTVRGARQVTSGGGPGAVIVRTDDALMVPAGAQWVALPDSARISSMAYSG
jgi:hypothetical protein